MQVTAASKTDRFRAVIANDRRMALMMQDAQNGCQDAYSRLLQGLRSVVGRMVVRQMPGFSSSDREDVLQDVLMSVHAARASYDSTRPFTPWLKAIVASRTIDFMRRQQRHAADDLSDEVVADVVDDSAAAAMTAHDVADVLHQAIRRLPMTQRSAIELLKLKELSLREAAVVTGMSVSALKASVHRAVKTLRILLASNRGTDDTECTGATTANAILIKAPRPTRLPHVSCAGLRSGSARSHE